MEKETNKKEKVAQAPILPKALNPKTKSEPSAEVLKQINEMKVAGIPLQMVVFNKTVRTAGGEPETALFHASAVKATRLAKLWYTPHGVLIEQAGVYKIIPLAAVNDTTVL